MPKSSPIIHDAATQRYIYPMSPSNAYVAYRRHGTSITLFHIEVDSRLRGQGKGEIVALAVFKEVAATGYDVTITCTYLRKIASKHDAYCGWL